MKKYFIVTNSLFCLILLSGCLHQQTPELRIAHTQQLYNELNYTYQQELHLLASTPHTATLKQKFKDEILMAHEYYLSHDRRSWFARFLSPRKPYHHYPYRRYKQQLTDDISSIRSALKYADQLYVPLHENLQALLQDLQKLHRILVTLDAYQSECQLREQERQQQELKQILKKQNEYLEEQNKLLKEQREAQQEKSSADSCIEQQESRYKTHTRHQA